MEQQDKKDISRDRHLLEQLANAEEALQSSEKKFRFLFDYSSDEIFLSDLEGKFIEVNQRACESLGYTRDELLKMRFTDIKTPRYRYTVNQNIKAIIEGGKLTYESEHLTKTGMLVPVEMKSRIISYEGRKVIMCVSRNIAERKAMEQKMLSAIIETEEKERKRFAADLHDELGPILSTLKLYTDLLKRDEFNSISRAEVLSNVDELSDVAIKTAKEISARITPNVLHDFGLAAAITEFSKFINETGLIKIHLKTDNYTIRTRSLTETVLYQTTKELINNTVKHASAENITIELKNTESQIVLYYRDDGIGFDFKKQLELSMGLGLNNIVNKVRTIKGNCDFHSNTGEGLIVVITVKIDKEDNKGGNN
ncbi:MAG: PAS domain S-box protein [Marinilabiliaceae bacterium]|jgi:PAS domain S-box-containing protein|nr:PAS domain S-box protein [Marinilabiliaceae bacterium]